jgi:hypothetical protein
MLRKCCYSLAPLVLASLASADTPKIEPPPASATAAELSTWVRQRVDERVPTAADRRFDEIGWAKDIRTAIRLAKENDRPVFLFTHDGRMNIGRC